MREEEGVDDGGRGLWHLSHSAMSILVLGVDILQITSVRLCSTYLRVVVKCVTYVYEGIQEVNSKLITSLKEM